MDNSMKKNLRFLIRSQNSTGTLITISAVPSVVSDIESGINSLSKEKSINFERSPIGYEIDAQSYFDIQDIIFKAIN